MDKQIWQIPEKVAKALRDIQKAVDELVSISGHKQKKFTLDGRIIGDIGEILVAHYFDTELTETQKKGFDAVISSGENRGRAVEIKCRKNSSGIGFKFIPEYLIVIEISKTEDTFELVYAGPGDVLRKIHPDFLSLPDPFKAVFDLRHFRQHFDYEEFMRNPCIPLRENFKPKVVAVVN